MSISLRKFILLLAGLILATGCHQGNAPKSKSGKPDGLQLKIAFRPAFNERSEISLVSTDSTKHIQILLRNQETAVIRPDTFYWKKVELPTQQYSELDTTMIQLCRQKLGIHYKKGWVDGMTFNSILITNSDTNTIGFFSPDRKNDSIGYFFSESLFTSLKKAFQDSVVDEYFDDIEVYIDESKLHRADPKRKIDQMRMEKDHWTIQDSKPSK